MLLTIQTIKDTIYENDKEHFLLTRNMYFENFEVWGCFLRIDAKLCCTTSNIHGNSVAESVFRYLSII